MKGRVWTSDTRSSAKETERPTSDPQSLELAVDKVSSSEMRSSRHGSFKTVAAEDVIGHDCGSCKAFELDSP